MLLGLNITEDAYVILYSVVFEMLVPGKFFEVHYYYFLVLYFVFL